MLFHSVLIILSSDHIWKTGKKSLVQDCAWLGRILHVFIVKLFEVLHRSLSPGGFLYVAQLCYRSMCTFLKLFNCL